MTGEKLTESQRPVGQSQVVQHRYNPIQQRCTRCNRRRKEWKRYKIIFVGEIIAKNISNFVDNVH